MVFLKKLLKKMIPSSVLDKYHKFLAVFSAFVYRNPSEKMIVIGVTGTNGKSTTTHLIAKTLEEAGFTVGYASTVGFKIAEKEWLNDKKMTMLGRFALQSLLYKMVKAGCRYAVIETSSEGIKQHRHLGINYDVAIFTNLTPEHIESHGSFERYRQAKERLFAHLTQKPNKVIEGKEVKKISIVNLDSDNFQYFTKYNADEKWGYVLQGQKNQKSVQNVVEVSDIYAGGKGIRFQYNGQQFESGLYGYFNVENLACVLTVAKSLGITTEIIQKAFKKVSLIPGRMEFISEGQNFKVLIDYAPEPGSLEALYKSLRYITYNRLIHVLGSAGGGRDKARRQVLGEMAARKADIVIVTNEDPYDEDPEIIINSVAKGAEDAGKVREVNLFTVLSRKQAIHSAFEKAREGDLVLLTGKGAEQAIVVAGGKKISWDEREVSREILQKYFIKPS